MTFAEWINFEAERIVHMGALVAEENQAGYMVVQIQAALKKAYARGRDGLTELDPPRTVSKYP
jgi:hypothetical protein